MARFKLTNFLTYRYRYQIGYSLTIVIFLALLFVAGNFIPGGLSASETKAFIATSSIDMQDSSTLAMANFPFFALQRLSMETFGLSIFTFKLPALIAAFVTGIGAVILLRRWFRPNIAVLATIIMITTGQFLYVAQSGTASITYIMWSVWLLLVATMVTYSEKHKRLWRLLLAIVIPLSLYTPMSIYLVLAILSAGVLHPHVRHTIRRVPLIEKIALPTISFVLSIPLILLCIIKPGLTLTLLGAPDSGTINIWHNLSVIFQQYFNFMHPSSGTLMTPVLDIGSMILIALGIWQLYKIRYTARSYTLAAWIIILIPLLVINPALVNVTFVPLLLLLASGLSYILNNWYGLFPKNPYARFAGVIPLTILVGGLVITGLYRYFDGYRYDPITASSFSKDLALFNSEVLEKDIKFLVVDKSEMKLYSAILRYNDDRAVSVSTFKPEGIKLYAATHEGKQSISDIPSKIITTDRTHDSDRFYIYKKG